uniref:Uncharacterized protein n=1 Tax=Anguilla anguilla TaxID=7936 RepID=A0A0E9XRS9_ANGAN
MILSPPCVGTCDQYCSLSPKLYIFLQLPAQHREGTCRTPIQVPVIAAVNGNDDAFHLNTRNVLIQYL